MSELTAGYVFKGKYEVGKKQGLGSLGETIFLGHDKEVDREIMIRILPPQMMGDNENTQRFIQGIKLTASINHPNILPAIDAGEENGMCFMVTAYKKGFYLNEYLDQRGQLDEPESLRLIKDLAGALNEAWQSQQIIHRNVCPDTILFAKGNVPLLTDFDMAKSLKEDKKLTMTGYTVGNPMYMSPEQVKGEQIDYHADMYCLGLVLYQLLSGHPPFQQKSQIELMNAQASEPHQPIQQENDRISDACAAVLDKMLEKDIADRYVLWEDLISDLDAILNQQAPKALQKGASRTEISKIKKEAKVEAKAAVKKEYKKKMDGVIDKLAFEKKRKFKRNIIILAVIINIILITLFVLYMQNKKDADQGKTTPIPAQPAP